MEYFVIDVETANHDYSSICQIGLVKVRSGEIIDKINWYLNPETTFDEHNTKIHGITFNKVSDSPTFKYLYPKLREKLNSKFTLHHTSFDRVAINRACSIHDLDPIETKWLDSSMIVRNTWSEFSGSGYGLSNLANEFNLNFKHHDALEDAIVTAKIITLACEESELSIDEWFKHFGKRNSRIGLKSNNKLTSNKWQNYEGLKRKIEGNPEGPLSNHNIVFTGKLNMSRKKAAEIASGMGCTVSTTVSKKTTLLVVGDQDLSLLAGYNKSTKQRKAEKLIEKGSELKIIDENGFYELCHIESELNG